MAAAAKHFPGLGAAARNQDTDLRPVTLAVGTAALRRVDERPYRAAVAAGVRLVMVSWAVYPALDPYRPAGLSPLVVQGELRQRLGFQGVTITDGLEGGALRRYGPVAQRASWPRRPAWICCSAPGTASARGAALRPALPAPTGTASSAGLPVRPR